jgi:uncharacterized protein (TIGR02145 family)
MKSKYFLIILIHIGIANTVSAQSISNVQSTLDSNSITINYNLNNIEDTFISVYLSENGGLTFSGPLMSVTGDVGFDVKAGLNKKIKWDVLSERGVLLGNNIVFRVTASKHGNFQDPRDGTAYKFVTIGKQVWMAENLAFKPTTGNYWAYDNNGSNVDKYGYLYDWQTACNVCPTGWHLPSDAEWTQLTDFMGGDTGTKLKTKSGWSNNGNGTNDYGFSALPGGNRYDQGLFKFIGHLGLFWSSTESSTNNAWNRGIVYDYSNVRRFGYNKQNGFSIRCLRDL